MITIPFLVESLSLGRRVSSCLGVRVYIAYIDALLVLNVRGSPAHPSLPCSQPANTSCNPIGPLAHICGIYSDRAQSVQTAFWKSAIEPAAQTRFLGGSFEATVGIAGYYSPAFLLCWVAPAAMKYSSWLSGGNLECTMPVPWQAVSN